MISNARYAVRDGDGGEGGTIIESIISNARYAVGSTIVGNGLWDNNFARVFVVTKVIPTTVGYCYVVAVKVVVIDTIDRKIVCPEGGGGKEGEE